MQPSRNPSLVTTPSIDHDRRRHGRIRTEEVTCSLGEVVDLSGSGMRVLRKAKWTGRPGDETTVTLKYGQFALPVDIRVVRIEKNADRRYIIGVEFQETNPYIRGKLTDLATIAAKRG